MMNGKIALEEHFAIPEYNQARPPFLSRQLWEQVQRRIVDFPELRLPEMDRHGIDYAVISLTSPGVQGETDAGLAVERARRANDVLAEAVAAHPDRFGGFAAVALQDIDAAVAEVTRAVTELGFHGVLVNSWTNQAPGVHGSGVGHLDEPRFDPFWARLEELGVPLYLHPRQLPAHQRELVDDRPELAGPVWEFATDCSASALRLIVSGLFDRRPGLQLILGHLGEGLPYDIWRIENRLRLAGDQPNLRKPISAYLRENVHLTTSGHFSTPSLRAAIDTVGAHRVMFSVDYPYESTEQAATWFDNLDLDDATRAALAADNAVRLLGLKPRDTATGGAGRG
jgi:2,3-dihydroxybenzoate decarboxylase